MFDNRSNEISLLLWTSESRKSIDIINFLFKSIQTVGFGIQIYN